MQLNKKVLLSINGLLLLIIWLLYFNRNLIFSYIPECLIKNATGLYCISCGGTRAFEALLNLEFLVAIKQNILLVIIGFVISISWITYNIEIFFDVKIIKIFKRYINLKILFILFIVIASIYWVLRNIPYYPFSMLAPY